MANLVQSINLSTQLFRKARECITTFEEELATPNVVNLEQVGRIELDPETYTITITDSDGSSITVGEGLEHRISDIQNFAYFSEVVSTLYEQYLEAGETNNTQKNLDKSTTLENGVEIYHLNALHEELETYDNSILRALGLLNLLSSEYLYTAIHHSCVEDFCDTGEYTANNGGISANELERLSTGEVKIGKSGDEDQNLFSLLALNENEGKSVFAVFRKDHFKKTQHLYEYEYQDPSNKHAAVAGIFVVSFFDDFHPDF